MAGCPLCNPDPSAASERERVLGRAVCAHRGGDAGAVVVGWFARIAVTLALVGMIGFDGISISVARAHVNDVASDAADAAAARYVQGFNARDALAAAVTKANAEGGTIAPDGLVITRAGHKTTLKVTVHLVASTAMLGHLPGTGTLNQTSSVVVRTVKQ